MIEGLEILIARMDTNPDEFINGEWDYFLEDHPMSSEVFTEEELQAFDSARDRLRKFKIERRRQAFTEQIIAQMMNREAITPKRVHPHTSQTVTDIIRQGVEKLQQGVTYTQTTTPEGYNITKDTVGRTFINGVLVK